MKPLPPEVTDRIEIMVEHMLALKSRNDMRLLRSDPLGLPVELESPSPALVAAAQELYEMLRAADVDAPQLERFIDHPLSLVLKAVAEELRTIEAQNGAP